MKTLPNIKINAKKPTNLIGNSTSTTSSDTSFTLSRISSNPKIFLNSSCGISNASDASLRLTSSNKGLKSLSSICLFNLSFHP